VHGRIVLDAIVMIRALATLFIDWRRTGRVDLGRYGVHAVALSIVMPVVWMTLGVLNGNNPRDVFADGNGQIFFAFAVAFVVLIRAGYGPWLRRWLLVACTVNAVVIGIIVAVSATRLVALEPTLRVILYDKLLVGNSIGYMPNGAYRLYLASGIYLQVGLVLVTWELIKNPRRWWPWALTALLWMDVIATYTRGFWLGSGLAVALVVVLGIARIRQAAVVAAGTAALFLAATVGGLAVGFSLPGYLTERVATSVSSGTNLPSPEASPTEPAPGVPIPPVIAGVDTSGEVSNLIRTEQARVLLGHIRERPILGWGFGTIAPDYRYGSIFSYELAFLDLWYKTGIVGLIFFLSFPLRLIVDALRARLGRNAIPPGLESRAMAVVIAVIGSVLASGATNPYFLAAFGLCPILAMIAWLDSDPRVTPP
jgi:O-antigen ligase